MKKAKTPATPQASTMTAKQFNTALAKLGFVQEEFGHSGPTASKGQTEFARTLNISLRSVQRFAAGEYPIPTPVAMLLNLMIRTKSTPDDLKG